MNGIHVTIYGSTMDPSWVMVPWKDIRWMPPKNTLAMCCAARRKTRLPAEGQEVPLATAFLAEYAAQLACSPVPNYDQLCAI